MKFVRPIRTNQSRTSEVALLGASDVAHDARRGPFGTAIDPVAILPLLTFPSSMSFSLCRTYALEMLDDKLRRTVRPTCANRSNIGER
jgi:hypothetical protein